jgi:hypothetical protein
VRACAAIGQAWPSDGCRLCAAGVSPVPVRMCAAVVKPSPVAAQTGQGRAQPSRCRQGRAVSLAQSRCGCGRGEPIPPIQRLQVLSAAPSVTCWESNEHSVLVRACACVSVRMCASFIVTVEPNTTGCNDAQRVATTHNGLQRRTTGCNDAQRVARRGRSGRHLDPRVDHLRRGARVIHVRHDGVCLYTPAYTHVTAHMRVAHPHTQNPHTNTLPHKQTHTRTHTRTQYTHAHDTHTHTHTHAGTRTGATC